MSGNSFTADEVAVGAFTLSEGRRMPSDAG
jgi:hypothetical protein